MGLERGLEELDMSFKNTLIGVIPKEWEIDELSNVAQIVDSLHQTPKYSDDGYPMVRVTDIKPGFLSLANCFTVNKETFEVFTKNYKPQSGDIVISRVGSYGLFSYVKTAKEFCLGQNTAIISPKIDNNYLYYCLLSKTTKDQIEKLAVGSTQKTLSLKNIKLINIPICSEKEQKSIAYMLSTIDEKIETNNQINKKLEEMAQVIFKQWFVDFEFPNEDGEHYKSSGGEMVESEMGMIPKGWEVAKISEVATIIRGASPRPIQDFMSDKGMPWLKISDATSSQGKYIAKIKEFIKEEGISKSRKVTQGTLVLSNSATPGMAKIMLLEACVHDGWLIFNDYKKISKEFMYYYLVQEREGILSLSNGSVFRNLKTDILKNYPIIIPNEEVIKKVNSIYVSINEDIKKRTLENEKLENIRDTLLPKLMSGEIRVPLNN